MDSHRPRARYQPCLKVNLLDRQDALVEHYSVSVPIVQHKPLEMSDEGQGPLRPAALHLVGQEHPRGDPS